MAEGIKMKIVAEIGCNHKGNIEIAKSMIDILAYKCGAHVAKFQKRNNKELLGEKYNDPHPCSEESYGETYGEHRERLEFSIEQHKELKAYCESKDIIYSCSVWDLTSTKEIVSINPVMIKIPSAQNNNYKILEYLKENYNGEIHISFGMTTKKEIEEIYNFMKDYDKLYFYSCTSNYPVSDNDICMKEIESLKKYSVKGYGVSGHYQGTIFDCMAVVYGVDYIERHFTLNKNWKGTDHIASLNPDEMEELVRNIKLCVKANKTKNKDILDCESAQRNKLKWHS
jgi:sialic acid synthase